MMQIEVNKICHRFKIPPATLDIDNLDKYPENAREKLKVALTCVKNAERTLTDFLDFLKTDKYSSWNKEQMAKREELLKSMIGGMMRSVSMRRRRRNQQLSWRGRFVRDETA